MFDINILQNKKQSELYELYVINGFYENINSYRKNVVKNIDSKFVINPKRITFVKEYGGIVESEFTNIYFVNDRENVRLVSRVEFFRTLYTKKWETIDTIHFSIHLSPNLIKNERLQIYREISLLENKLSALNDFFLFENYSIEHKSNIYILDNYDEYDKFYCSGYYAADMTDTFDADISCLKNINYHEVVHMLFLVNGFQSCKCDLIVEGCAELNKYIISGLIPEKKVSINTSFDSNGNFLEWTLDTYETSGYFCYRIIKDFDIMKLKKLYKESSYNSLTEQFKNIYDVDFYDYIRNI